MKIIVLLILALLVWGQPTRQELKELESDAIVFGQGANHVYAFVDPLCPNSKNYIEVISTHKLLLKTNTYYVFLYRLKRFDSDSLIDSIYMAQDPKNALVHSVVLHEELEVQKASEKVVALRKRIRSIALKTKMKHRPYVIIYNAQTNTCKVSEGTAPCMDTK